MKWTWAKLLDAWYGTFTEATKRQYDQALRDFRDYADCPTIPALLERLTEDGPAGANALTVAWRRDMRERRELKASTCRQRVNAVSSLLKFARAFGKVDFGLTLKRLKISPKLERKNLALGQVARCMRAADTRLRALLWLLYDPALRVGEVVALRVSDVDLETRTVCFTGKMRDDVEFHDLPRQGVEAIREWLGGRNADSPWLFPSPGDPRRHVTRMSAYRWVRDLGDAVGIDHLYPHRFRHAGVTQAARVTECNPAKTKQFSRHADIKTVLHYVELADGQRQETVDAVADALSDLLTTE